MSDINAIIADIEAALPTVEALVAALDPKAAATVAIADKLGVIAAQFWAREQAIRANLDPALMEQIAADNRAADAGLVGN